MNKEELGHVTAMEVQRRFGPGFCRVNPEVITSRTVAMGIIYTNYLRFSRERDKVDDTKFIKELWEATMDNLVILHQLELIHDRNAASKE